MLAHVHIMKTAGQTFRGILRQSFPGRHCDLMAGHRPATASDIRWARHFYPGLKKASLATALAHIPTSTRRG